MQLHAFSIFFSTSQDQHKRRIILQHINQTTVEQIVLQEGIKGIKNTKHTKNKALEHLNQITHVQIVLLEGGRSGELSLVVVQCEVISSVYITQWHIAFDTHIIGTTLHFLLCT